MERCVSCHVQQLRVCVTEKCLQPSVVGNCRAKIPAWYYDTTSNQCQRFYYGGCGGNDNRFSTYEDCVRECAPGSVSSFSVTLDLSLCEINAYVRRTLAIIDSMAIHMCSILWRNVFQKLASSQRKSDIAAHALACTIMTSREIRVIVSFTVAVEATPTTLYPWIRVKKLAKIVIDVFTLFCNSFFEICWK